MNTALLCSTYSYLGIVYEYGIAMQHVFVCVCNVWIRHCFASRIHTRASRMNTVCLCMTYRYACTTYEYRIALHHVSICVYHIWIRHSFASLIRVCVSRMSTAKLSISYSHMYITYEHSILLHRFYTSVASRMNTQRCWCCVTHALHHVFICVPWLFDWYVWHGANLCVWRGSHLMDTWMRLQYSFICATWHSFICVTFLCVWYGTHSHVWNGAKSYVWRCSRLILARLSPRLYIGTVVFL